MLTTMKTSSHYLFKVFSPALFYISGHDKRIAFYRFSVYHKFCLYFLLGQGESEYKPNEVPQLT